MAQVQGRVREGPRHRRRRRGEIASVGFARRLLLQAQCLLGLPLLRVLLDFSVSGPRVRPRPGGVILAPNHQSWLDPVLVQAAVYPHAVTFLMTELFYDLPVANLYFRAMGARPVRENGPSVSGMRAALDALRAGEIVCLFPEGGLSNDGRLQPGRRGVARIARRSGAPVVPVGIRGSFHVLSRAQRIPRLHPVSVRLGAEMPPPAQDGREAEARFLDELMARIGALAS